MPWRAHDHNRDLPPITTGGDLLLLSDRRHRRYLTGLLQQRAAFAALTVQRESHFLADARDHRMWLEAIEQAIEDGWPQLYVDLLPDWVRDDVALMHTPEQPNQACGICAAVWDTPPSGDEFRLPQAAWPPAPPHTTVEVGPATQPHLNCRAHCDQARPPPCADLRSTTVRLMTITPHSNRTPRTLCT